MASHSGLVRALRPRPDWRGRPGSAGELDGGRVARWKGRAEFAPRRGQRLGACLGRLVAEAESNTGLHAGLGKVVAVKPIVLPVLKRRCRAAALGQYGLLVRRRLLLGGSRN